MILCVPLKVRELVNRIVTTVSYICIDIMYYSYIFQGKGRLFIQVVGLEPTWLEATVS